VIVCVALSAVAVAIIARAFYISFAEGKNWIETGNRQKMSDRVLSPIRGNILSDDDRIMASNSPRYYIYLDFNSDSFRRKGDLSNNRKSALPRDGAALDSFYHGKRNNVDSLAFYLSRKLKDRTKDGYKAHLLKGLKSKNRNFRIYDKKITYADLKEIKTFPLIRIKDQDDFFATRDMMQRDKPFGTLAARTIGDIYGELLENGVTKARSGLELQYDSLLRGSTGVRSFIRLGRQYKPNDIEPKDGIDVRTTININFQDMVEKALTDKLKEVDADAGAAVVMEVNTGEIKAIANMGRLGPGRYAETVPHALVDQIEPGSTFKVASMMVAIEDKKCTPTTPVNVGDGRKMIGERYVTDHNYARGGYGMITAEQSIWYSSNIGVTEIIYNAYKSNPTKFIEGLHRIGMDADLKIAFPGVAKPKLKWPSDRSRYGWSNLSLSTIPYGYEVIIPPIQTLTFFNAIANNGKMVRPRLVTDFLQNGQVIKHFPPDVAIQQICSERTLKIIQNMLYNVVNFHETTPGANGRRRPDGTGKPAKSDVVTIAGKTGTAVRATGGVYRSDGYNVSFCGYFPYENPLYSCIVVISRPRNGGASGGLMCGTVVKEIAEKIYSSSIIVDVDKVKSDSVINLKPDVLRGNPVALKAVASALGVRVETSPAPSIGDFVPDVTGMGAKDAVFAMEQCGLKPVISGLGKVESQSVQAGTKAKQGQTVALTLR